MLRGYGIVCLLGTVPLLWIALRYLAGRDYVAGALVIVASAAVGHLGLELVALAEGARGAGGEGEEQ